MSVRNCAFPWHWLIVTADGIVMPCSHGSRPVGNLRDNTTKATMHDNVEAYIVA